MLIKFSNHFNKSALFLRKFQLVIKGADQIFKTLQQKCFIFVKISTPDKRGRSNSAIFSANILCCLKHIRA